MYYFTHTHIYNNGINKGLFYNYRSAKKNIILQLSIVTPTRKHPAG